MDARELRYRVIAALLQSGQPLTLHDLGEACGTQSAETLKVLHALLGERLVVAIEPSRAGPSSLYCWRARWEERRQREARGVLREAVEAVAAASRVPDADLTVGSPPSVAFHKYVVERYRPPEGKRYLVFFQCSVRRPFSSSPSHASLRRAVRLATGADPHDDAAGCPVHVVVLASKIGPVPYELEDVYPANVRGGGVKHLTQVEYDLIEPVLAQRVADYMVAHAGHYERYASFTEGRYGRVMHAADRLARCALGAGEGLRVFPQEDGPQVVRMGTSVPRTYWARYWIQLCLEVLRWLPPEEQGRARKRLERCGVVYTK